MFFLKSLRNVVKFLIAPHARFFKTMTTQKKSEILKVGQSSQGHIQEFVKEGGGGLIFFLSRGGLKTPWNQ